jgi:hypothetical protein
MRLFLFGHFDYLPEYFLVELNTILRLVLTNMGVLGILVELTPVKILEANTVDLVVTRGFSGCCLTPAPSNLIVRKTLTL